MTSAAVRSGTNDRGWGYGHPAADAGNVDRCLARFRHRRGSPAPLPVGAPPPGRAPHAGTVPTCCSVGGRGDACFELVQPDEPCRVRTVALSSPVGSVGRGHQREVRAKASLIACLQSRRVTRDPQRGRFAACTGRGGRAPSPERPPATRRRRTGLQSSICWPVPGSRNSLWLSPRWSSTSIRLRSDPAARRRNRRSERDLGYIGRPGMRCWATRRPRRGRRSRRVWRTCRGHRSDTGVVMGSMTGAGGPVRRH